MFCDMLHELFCTAVGVGKEYAKEFPEYAFEKHKGYGTKVHIEKIKEIGPCRLHRKTFIKNFWVE